MAQWQRSPPSGSGSRRGPQASSGHGHFTLSSFYHEIFWNHFICLARPHQGHKAPDNIGPRFIGAHKPLHHDEVTVLSHFFTFLSFLVFLHVIIFLISCLSRRYAVDLIFISVLFQPIWVLQFISHLIILFHISFCLNLFSLSSCSYLPLSLLVPSNPCEEEVFAASVALLLPSTLSMLSQSQWLYILVSILSSSSPNCFSLPFFQSTLLPSSFLHSHGCKW